MWLERPATKAAALVLVLCSLLGSPGCDSFYARQTFDGATLGQPWSRVSGAEQYGMNGQLAFYSIEGPGEQDGSDYYIVVSDRGKVIAKAYSIAGSASAFGLQIEAKYWPELKEVQSHYPYYRSDNLGLLEPVYPPLVHPLSADDKVLPSGVRQSTWASLTHSMWGWPFQTKYERWVAETKVYWNGTLKGWPEVVQSVDLLPAEGTITVFWLKGPLSH